MKKTDSALLAFIHVIGRDEKWSRLGCVTYIVSISFLIIYGNISPIPWWFYSEYRQHVRSAGTAYRPASSTASIDVSGSEVAGSPFPEDVWAWWLLMHWLQLQFTPCEALPSVWIGFAWQYSQACGHLCCLCTFSYSISSFQSTLNLICFDTALLEQPPPFSNDPLCLTLFVEDVNDRLLDHYQVSSVPHYCAFKEQEIPRIYTVRVVIYWNTNVNIIIFWDTDFWLSLAVSSKKLFKFYFTCNESKIYESFTFWIKLQEKMNFFTIFFFFRSTFIQT